MWTEFLLAERVDRTGQDHRKPLSPRTGNPLTGGSSAPGSQDQNDSAAATFSLRPIQALSNQVMLGSGTALVWITASR